MDWLLRVEDVCGSSLSAKALRERLLGLIREQVPYDAHVFTLTDPVTKVATSPHADVPMLPWPRLPELIRWRYLTTANRIDRLLGQPAWSRGTAGATDLPMWDHVLRDLGIVDAASVAFGDRYGAWGFLELWRTSSPFTPDELAHLTALTSAVSEGLRAAVARTFVDEAEQLLPVGPAVVVLNPDLTVRAQTEGAADALLQLLPPDEPMAPIPAVAFNVGAALIAEEQGHNLGEPRSRIHLGGNRWVTAKASRLGEEIVVSIEPSTSAERMDLFGRAFGLSARESQVLDQLGLGKDSKAIAATLFLSEHTVNDHVKAILGKTGTRTRQVLVSRALGAT